MARPRAARQNPRMFLRVDDVLLNTVAFGDPAAPAFLGHGGWVGSWELWQEPFELMQHTWRCLGYDHRGSGATSASAAQITPQALVDDVFRVMDHYGVESCVLAGESLGALTAITAALQQPERVRGLVLVDGVMAAGQRPPHPMIAGVHADYPATVQWFVDACVPEPDAEHIRRWGRQILLRTDPELAARIFEAYDEEPVDPPVEDLQQPTLVLHGEQDVIAPRAAAEAVAARIPRAELVVVPGAGHVPTLTMPERVVAAIDEWWRRVGDCQPGS